MRGISRATHRIALVKNEENDEEEEDDDGDDSSLSSSRRTIFEAETEEPFNGSFVAGGVADNASTEGPSSFFSSPSSEYPFFRVISERWVVLLVYECCL